MITIKGERYKDGGLIIESDSYKKYVVSSVSNEFDEGKVVHTITNDLRVALDVYERLTKQ